MNIKQAINRAFTHPQATDHPRNLVRIRVRTRGKVSSFVLPMVSIYERAGLK